MARLTFEVKQHLTGHIQPLVVMQIQAWLKQHKLHDQSCPSKKNKKKTKKTPTQIMKHTAHCNYTYEENIQQCMHSGMTFDSKKENNTSKDTHQI